MTRHFLRYSQLTAITGLSEMTLRRMVAAGQFPTPVRVSPNAVAFDSAAIEKWFEDRIAASQTADALA